MQQEHLLIGGISAYNLLKKRNLDFFNRSFKISMIVAFISSIGIMFSGHDQAQHLNGYSANENGC